MISCRSDILNEIQRRVVDTSFEWLHANSATPAIHFGNVEIWRSSPVQGNENIGSEGRGSFFRPKSVGRSVGRKFGVLYDDYVKYVFVTALGFNKADKSIVLHTQEVTGSSPVAPTI